MQISITLPNIGMEYWAQTLSHWYQISELHARRICMEILSRTHEEKRKHHFMFYILWVCMIWKTPLLKQILVVFAIHAWREGKPGCITSFVHKLKLIVSGSISCNCLQWIKVKFMENSEKIYYWASVLQVSGGMWTMGFWIFQLGINTHTPILQQISFWWFFIKD